jgi:hypothetical protein
MKVGQLSQSQMSQQGQALRQSPTVTPSPFHIILFGKKPPRLVDRRKYPKLKKALRRLDATMGQLSELMGVSEETFSLELAEGANATVSKDGQIAFGVELLSQHEKDDDLLVAILAHEMGHQPWTWPESDVSRLSLKSRQALARKEEAKADQWAGRALAELGISPERVCEFLLRRGHFERKSLDYDPPEIRVKTLRNAHSRRARALKDAARIHPHLVRRQRELR